MPRKEMTKTEKEKRKQERKTETKEERFVRIAKPRLQKALKNLHMVQAMVANKQYGVDEVQLSNIIALLESEKSRFTSTFDSRTRNETKEEIEVNL